MLSCRLILLILASWSISGVSPRSDCDAADTQFRCTDTGAEPPSPRHRRADGGDECVLPPYPAHGTYTVSGAAGAAGGPGDRHQSFVLAVSCVRGYGIAPPARPDHNDTLLVYCFKGTWFQNMPECVKYCELSPDPSIRYMCHVPGTGFKACGSHVAPGTSVKPVCNSPNYHSTETLLFMQCAAGAWDYSPQCKAECGRITPKGVQLVIGGRFAKRGELPWHVGIYQRIGDAYEQICGGSLVTNNAVISAAHCFWNDAQKQVPADQFAVAAGKLQRSWHSAIDIGVQTSQVDEIKIPRLYDGLGAHFQEDIAVLILTTPFVYKTYVRPVCLHFDTNFDSIQLQDGKLGKVAGWGLIAATGTSSPDLKVVDMPYVDVDVCIQALPPAFRAYVTGDKFCAGFTNGTALCRGDSGGGLTFAATELGVERHYLRGVVSASPSDDGVACNDHTYTTFTKITKHQQFIRESLEVIASAMCPSTKYRCADGTCVPHRADCRNQQCIDVPESSCASNSSEADPARSCVLPPYPEHGTYSVAELPSARPGQAYESFLLTVRCSPGYQPTLDNGTTTPLMYCVRGSYQNMPKCVSIPCSNEGARGACVPLGDCRSAWLRHLYLEAGYIEDHSAKLPKSCSSQDGTPLVCCTDCPVDGQKQNKEYFVSSAGTLIENRRTGSKARDKCLEYHQRLPYSCGARRNISAERTLDAAARCHRYELRAPPYHAPRALGTPDAQRWETAHMVVALFERKNAQGLEDSHCDGVIVSERFVLVSASCIKALTSEISKLHSVALDVQHRNSPTASWRQVKVKRFIPHPDFDIFKATDNIALVETATEIAFDKDVLPICLDIGDTDISNGAHVLSWTSEKFSQNSSDTLKAVHVEKNTEERCERRTSDAQRVTAEVFDHSSQLCYLPQSQDNFTECYAQLGRPLVTVDAHCTSVALGLVAHQWDCGSSEPVIFTRLAHYAPWIESVVWP